MTKHKILAPRIGWISLWFAIVILGILSRKLPLAYEFLGKYPGDALWAMQLAVAMRIAFPHWSLKPWLSLALILCVGNEVLQGIPWEPLDQFSRHTVGHYFLGTEFGWGDIISNVVGIGLLALGLGLGGKKSRPLEI
jgi:hypothetical protein